MPILSAFWTCRHYLLPQLRHFVVLFSVILLSLLLGIFVVLLSEDLLTNKIYLAEPLSVMQANLLALDPARFVDTKKLTEAARLELRTTFLIVIVVLLVAQFVLSQGMNYYRTWILQRVNQDLRVAMMTNAVQLSLRYHNSHQVGDVIYRAYQDSAMVTAIVQTGLIQPIILIGGFLAAEIVLAAFSPILALLFLLAILPAVLFAKLATPRLRLRSQAARLANSGLTSHIQETVQATKLLKSLNVEGSAFADFVDRSHAALDRAYELRRTVVILSLAVFFCTAIVVVITDYIMVQLVWDEAETVGYGVIPFIGFALWNLGAFRGAREQTGAASGNVVGLVNTWSLLQDMGVGLRRAMFLLQYEPEIKDSKGAKTLKDTPIDVEFENVSFSYQPNRAVLRDVSMVAKPGTVTALVGGSGAGKSTLMSLLLRLYDVDQGTVRVGGIDVRELKQDSLRGHVSIVLQENALFPMTIEENIRFSRPEATDEELMEAVRISCVDEFLDEFPNGIKTELGERGAKLSTGQRQRISIARAILKNTPILILDEPTASLDLKTERVVLERISEWAQNKVVFLITHRVATTARANQVVFIENGTVAELGTPASLLAQSQGRYRSFVEADSADAA